MHRPTSVTVLGILNLVFAAFGLMGMAASLAMMFMPLELYTKNPVLELIRQNPGYAMYANISMIFGGVLTLILGLAGIGLLMLRPWGRWLSLAYAFLGIISVFVNSTVSYYFILAPLIAKQAALPPGPEKIAALGGIVGMVAGSCFGLIYPVVLWFFMFRPNVIEAFDLSNPPDPSRI